MFVGFLCVCIYDSMMWTDMNARTVHIVKFIRVQI